MKRPIAAGLAAVAIAAPQAAQAMDGPTTAPTPPKPDPKVKALRIYDAAKDVSRQQRSYFYGGGHGLPLPDLKTGHSPLDCSSSVSLVLYRAKVFGSRFAETSGAIAANWGRRGHGRWVTVYANSGHVWIKFRRLGKWVRFDTSSYGSGGSGPRVRATNRPHSGFVPRHVPGT